MIDFKIVLVLGLSLQEVKYEIDNFENMHLSFFINSLRYKNEDKGKKLKRELFGVIL